jgi:hypothetical protein
MASDLFSLGKTQTTATINTPLPTKEQVLRTIYFHQNFEGDSISCAISKVADKLFGELERMGFRPMTKGLTESKH